MAETKLLKEMGNRISSRRKSMKMTQAELAETIGVSTQMISNLELGKKAVRPENLVKICEVLNISADFVLTGNGANNQLSGIAEKLVYLTSEELQMVNDMIEYMKNKRN